MERLQLKVSQLEQLWHCLGTHADNIAVADKLQFVLQELDKVIAHESWRKTILLADIEDTIASIDDSCRVLGISMESLLTAHEVKDQYDWECFAASPEFGHGTFDRQHALATLNNRLTHEIHQRRLHVKEWRATIQSLCVELGVTHDLTPYDEDDLSWATVQKVSCTLRDLSYKQTQNQQEFEYLTHAMHFYWTVLAVPVDCDDPVDFALNSLCSHITMRFDMHQKPDASTAYACLYYQYPLPFPLSLEDGFIAVLRRKVQRMEMMYEERLAQFNKHAQGMEALWHELNVPPAKQCAIEHSLHPDNLAVLQEGFDQMKDIVRVMLDEYLEEIHDELVQLWDGCLLTQLERDEFIATVYDTANSMDEIKAIMSRHLEYLQHILPAANKVSGIMQERRSLIQAMIDFEASASNPQRLFTASFQLMEEERFRKTCFPTLLQLDDALIKSVQDFESISGKHFMVGTRRYLDILMDEIADRTTNQTFFGFLNTEPDQDRPMRTKPRYNSLYTSTVNTNISKKRSKTLCTSPTMMDASSSTSSSSVASAPMKRPSLHTKRSSTYTTLAAKSAKRPQDRKRHSAHLVSTSQHANAPPSHIIPEQYKSKSYPISTASSATTADKRKRASHRLSASNESIHTHQAHAALPPMPPQPPQPHSAMDAQQQKRASLQDLPDALPSISPRFSHKGSSIPIRVSTSPTSNKSTNSSSSASSQQPLPVECN
ncbi:microtubule associated protein-domain-containing protein [Gongronella butleri]|nr:microtubule associated protein-domain-containing protein [Gongronella butleri]